MKRSFDLLNRIFPYFLSLFTALLVTRCYQWLCGPETIFGKVIKTEYYLKGTLMDLVLALLISLLAFALSYLISYIIKRPIIILMHVLSVICILANFSLTTYFIKTNQLLGDAFFQFTPQEIIITAGLESNLDYLTVIWIILLLLIYFILPKFFLKKEYSTKLIGTWFFLLVVSVCVYPFKLIVSKDYVGDLVINNKLLAFTSIIENRFIHGDEVATVNREDFLKLDHSFFQDPTTKSNAFPLMHHLPSNSSLQEFISNKKSTPPNIVIIIVESLSSYLVGDNKYNPCHFMPFMDSLSKESLYFPNFMATCERTHNVLPAVLGSTPNPPEKVFMQNENYPRHVSLMSLLGKDYYSSFYCGVDLGFCNMENFMQYNKTNYLVKNWGEKYSTTVEGVANPWGYPDGDLFNKYFDDQIKKPVSKPKLTVFLTISTHDPLVYPGKKNYRNQVLERLQQVKTTPQLHQEITTNAEMYGSYIYTDDVLKSYFEKMKKSPEYENTLFFILGDHGNHFFPRNEIQKYQTPLLIFSPLITKKGQFNTIASHNDITPTIINYLRLNYPALKLEQQVPFFGNQLVFDKPFTATRTLPLLNLDSETKHLIYNNYYHYEGSLYTFNKSLELTPVNNQKINQKLTTQLKLMRKYAQYLHNYDRIMSERDYEQHTLFRKKELISENHLESIDENLSAAKFIDLGKPVVIQPIQKEIQIDITGEIFLKSEKELADFPKLTYSVLDKSQNMLAWSNKAPKLQAPFKPNSWNKVLYSVIVKTPKNYANSTLNYYIFNVLEEKVKLKALTTKMYRLK